jgi:hypothetical protein
MVTSGGAVSAFYSTSCVVRLSNSKYLTACFLRESLFDREDGGSMFFRNVSELPKYTASHARIWYSSKYLVKNNPQPKTNSVLLNPVVHQIHKGSDRNHPKPVQSNLCIKNLFLLDPFELTERCGWVDRTYTSYSLGPRFESRPCDELFWLRHMLSLESDSGVVP